MSITNPPFSYAFSLIYGYFIQNYVMIFQNTIIKFSNIKKNKVSRAEDYKNKAMEVTEVSSVSRATEFVCQIY